jgi:hypothetical protein
MGLKMGNAFKKLVLTTTLILSSLAAAKEGMYDVVPKDPQLFERWNASVGFYGLHRTRVLETETFGSGVVLAIEPVDEKGLHQVYIVTAWHVVNPQGSVPFGKQIILNNTTARKGVFQSSDAMARGVRLVAKDTHLDLALVSIKVSALNAARLDIAPYGCNFNDKGVVHSIGFPATSKFSEAAARKVPNPGHWTKRISQGRFFDFSEVGDDMMVFDVDGAEGSSGGGIFNDRNELMSVVTDGDDSDNRSRKFSKASFNERTGEYKGVETGPECNNFVDFIRKSLPASALAYSEYHPTLPEFQPEYEGTATADSRKAGALR